MKTFPEIKLTNTLTGKKEIFKSYQPGQVSFYSCGPTVYGHIHIGNLRAALVADMIFRFFKHVGYDVNFVRNYTDVDDKIIKRGKEEGISAGEVAKKYTIEVEKDFAAAGIQEPTHKTTVTTHMPEIIALIEKIIKSGKGYVVGGEVYFKIEAFPGYGKLSHKKIDDLEAGARVDVSEKKNNPLDFSLWKPAKLGEPSWDSPWGKGRPGWHIECSAMSSKWLGDQIDLHHGGEDLIFPHHENEIAQSEAASGKEPFVKYWLHHAFVTLSKEKMSKSVGNVFLAKDFLGQFSGEVARYLLLATHYRSPIDLGDETIETALTSIQRLYEAKAKASEVAKLHRVVPDLRAESGWGSFVSDCEKAKTAINSAYANDFNSAEALAALFTLIREFNRILAEPRAAATPSATLGAQQLIEVIEKEIGAVLGIGLLNPAKGLGEIQRIRASRLSPGGATKPSEQEIKDLIQQRLDARKAKDFAKADQIRKDLAVRGVVLKDSPSGTTWEYQ